jgi:bacterioferritin-associated ferredoxin
MYVCVCAAVTDRQVRAAAAAGVDSLDQLTMRLGVGAGCGCCREMAQQMLAETCGTTCPCASECFSATP